MGRHRRRRRRPARSVDRRRVLPLAGLLIGAFGGALVGKAIDQGLDEDVIKQVEADMQLAAESIDADKVDAVTAVIADVSAVDSD